MLRQEYLIWMATSVAATAVWDSVSWQPCERGVVGAPDQASRSGLGGSTSRSSRSTGRSASRRSRRC